MMNLFSPFNPISTQNMSMNWMMMMMPMILIMIPYWSTKSKMIMMKKKLVDNIIKQFKPSMKKMNTPNMIMIMMLMLMIYILNTASMLPSTFSTTSHITMNLSMALVMWVALTMKKIKHMMKFMANLTPPNTPPTLIPLMVMIELTSMIIQPMTLSIRLTANVMAGHIMMILIAQMYQNSVMMALMMNMSMMLLELAVSLIQAYVFSMLIIMYSK